MNGLELSYEYYIQYGAPMISKLYPEFEERIACGLAGSGSECFGFDDELSRDHDFGPGFCMWLTDDDMNSIGESLNQSYENLPQQFMGYQAKPIMINGEKRVGAIRISDFYRKFIGLGGVPDSLYRWLAIPEEFLATTTNGRVFSDKLGEFSRIRNALLDFYPEDVRLKKIATRAAVMAQAGQYNYPRCLKRSEFVAAQCALGEFIKAACSMVYLLNKRYAPFYKWAHHGLKDMSVIPEAYVLLSRICEAEPKDKTALIEELCDHVIRVFRSKNLSDVNSDFLLDHSLDIIDRISDPEIKSLHVFAER